MTAPHRPRPTHAPSRPRAAIAVAVAISLSVLAGCGSSGGGGDDAAVAAGGPSSTIDISDLGKEPSTTTTTEAEATTTTKVPSRDPAANGCRAAQVLFLEPAGDPGRIPATPSDAEREQLEGQVMMRLGAMERVQLRALLAFEKEARANPSARPPAGLDPVAVAEHFIRWTNDNCPPPQPAWACIARSKFTPVGNAISADGSPSPDTEPGTFPTPEATLASLFDGGSDAVDLGRTDTTAWYGWTDAAGLVMRVQEIVNVGGGWKFGSEATCNGPGTGSVDGNTAVQGSGEQIAPLTTVPPSGPVETGRSSTGRDLTYDPSDDSDVGNADGQWDWCYGQRPQLAPDELAWCSAHGFGD